MSTCWSATRCRESAEPPRAAARNPKARTIDLAGGGIAVYDPAVPTNVHLAYPKDAYQVEVFSPDAGVALRLVSKGAIRPVR